MTGKFITFEGIDGSGKTTISREVYKLLQKKNKDIILTREPTDTWRGEMITKAIEENCHPLTIALTFMADRNEHVIQIRKWLEKKSIVLCDRYMDSTFAYQTTQLSQNIKNPHSDTAQAARNLISTNRLALTGTPVENNTMELWSQFSFLSPGLLGAQSFFKENFMRPIEKEQNEQIASTLKKIIFPFILRRTKEEVSKNCRQKLKILFILR